MWKITGKVAAAVGKLVAAALLISFLSIWTTGYVVNSYVETLLKQFHIPLEEQPFALSGLWGEMWGADPGAKDVAKSNTADSSTGKDGTSGANADSKDSDQTSSDSGSGHDTSANAGSDDTAPSGSSTDSQGTASTGGDNHGSGNGQDAVDAFGDLPEGQISDIGGGTGPKGNSAAAGQESGAGTNASGSSKDEVAMSTDDINAAKSQISQADKDQLFNVMIKKLPVDAWQQISKLMEDGLTTEEMTQVNQLMAQYLDRDEYDQMSSILSKY
ncbi:hypothetical protein GZH47_16375 [Paenibacillus rhizovicinus]|uniref:Spore coat protein n=1 Tax=Paenibacillus rhizovicinus TaxID=2704463 RepID=A0A6C0P6J9_9BACL|nr:hypothetical protein [Paenibacillus rhizovicinus]QHW32222.1 hypothetical protein GZH47_16375 [Paenibacillus rhizovicinus]